MYYRLIESAIPYGFQGITITREEYVPLPHHNKCLFEPRQDDDPFYCKLIYRLIGTDKEITYVTDSHNEIYRLSWLLKLSSKTLKRVHNLMKHEKDFQIIVADGNLLDFKYGN